MSAPNYAARLLLALALLIAWRLVSAQHAGVELYGDEAQYWTWSLAPDWGYYSKPPMVAWAIWLGTALFGDSEAGVRALSTVVYPLTAGLLFLLVRRLFRGEPEAERLAFWTGLLFACLPMVSMGSWLITTDAFLLLFWSLSLWLAWRALESGRWFDWLGLGVAIGLGLLSKYSMVFFGLGLFVYLALTPARRHWLSDPRPYAAALVALLVLAPNMVWNANHEFVSYQHTAEISKLDRELFHPKAMLEFFLGQFLVFGPLTFAGLLALAGRPGRWWTDDRLRFLAAFALAPLAAFLGLSLLSRSFINWAAFVYAPASALLAIYWLRGRRARLLAIAVAVNLSLAAGLYYLHDISDLLGVQLTRKTDPYKRVTGHRALGAAVAERLHAAPGTRLLVDDRMLYALLRYYARPASKGALYLNRSGRINNHYALTADVGDAPKGAFLLVSRNDLDAELAGWFAEVRKQPSITLNLYPDYAPEFRVWSVRDYRGP